MRRYGHVVLGGTFDRLHVGHAALLAAAFRAGRAVSVGVTTERFLRRHPKPRAGAIAPFRLRRRALARWVARHFPRTPWRAVPLESAVGGAVDPGVDALVVSAESVAGGRAVNRERRRRHLPPVPLLVVPLVLADDLEPVSSRRIRAGEIDPSGRRRSAIAVGLAVARPEDVAPAVAGLRRIFPRAVVTRLPPSARRSSAGELARDAQRGRQLGLGVVRRRSGGWTVAVRAPRVALGPHPVPPGAAGGLAGGVARRLRPRRPKPL